MLPDSPIRQKRRQRCIQHLCAEEHFEEEPHESFEKKLDTLETGRNNEADDTKKKFLNSSSMFYPLKVVQEIIVIESDVE